MRNGAIVHAKRNGRCSCVGYPYLLHTARPFGHALACPALRDAGVSRSRGLSPRHGLLSGGFALMRIAPVKADVIF